MNRKWYFSWIVCLLGILSTASALDLRQEPQVRRYIEFLSEHYQFDPKQLNDWFTQVKFDPVVLRKISQPPGEVIPWYQYRRLFLTPQRQQAGIAFWRNNRHALAQAEKKYGVPAEIIVGIIGVETTYGDNKGQFSEMDALSTLAFQYPRRSQFFTSELTHFLLLSREQGWDPLSIKASYAGALGLPQFMPSSYRQYAVGADHPGERDLLHNPHDAIFSVGNYLHQKGWKRGEPVVVRAKLLNENFHELGDGALDGKTRFTVKELAKVGIVPIQSVSSHLPAGVLFMEGEKGTEVWMTFPNFGVIKKYNMSNRYALVVDQLGVLVKQSVHP